MRDCDPPRDRKARTVNTGHDALNVDNINGMGSTTGGDRRTYRIPILVGCAEIAEMAGVQVSAVSNWRKRYKDFPNAVAELRMGPVFCLAAIEKWIEQWR